MNKSDLKKLIKEELQSLRRSLREEDSLKPVVNSKKAGGIILGAVKTLINSGAITGIDSTNATNIASELVKHLSVAVAPYGQPSVPQGDDLNDDSAYEKEEESLDDQSQYDPDLSKQTSDHEPKPAEPEDDEPLFEIKKIAKKLKL